MKIFVYGTLMTGYSNFSRHAEFVKSAKPATAKGVIYDLGAFPGARFDEVTGDNSEGLIHGELHDIGDENADEVLMRLDRLEGYRFVTDTGFYLRREITVAVVDADSPHNETKAYAYHFNGHLVGDGRGIIENGVWKPSKIAKKANSLMVV